MDLAGGSATSILRDELEHLKLFFADADTRSENEEPVKLWLKQIKFVAKLIEDVIKEYIFKVSQGACQRGSISFPSKAGQLIGMLNNRRNLASNI
ncbi:hypothetical protein TorRG33x02_175320 [Trema orientale]|uniref:Disease resistance N-terminal domain-containing protein n=1 Tax=Trema orientale TaxID=63057 RepID=A0A2P5EMC3_TREOI|nr:hypothetical protein TorRG33x02_175320 [Trema orientale]